MGTLDHISALLELCRCCPDKLKGRWCTLLPDLFIEMPTGNDRLWYGFTITRLLGAWFFLYIYIFLMCTHLYSQHSDGNSSSANTVDMLDNEAGDLSKDVACLSAKIIRLFPASLAGYGL